MIASMTAFARVESAGPWGRASWEVRAVNHRYLDLSLRLPEALRALEPAIRERLAARLSRGKVECGLRYETGAADAGLQVNQALAQELIQAAAALEVEGPATLNRLEVLKWPGVMETRKPALEEVSDPLLALLEQAIDEVVQTRRREGEKIKALLETRCALCLAQLEQVREKMPAILEAAGERCRARAQALEVKLEEGRLEQELVLLAQKLDVEEELDRLEAHLREIGRVMEEDRPNGRRLDFLMQEMNREANTLGAKSADLVTNNASIELKVLIEQMREQAQNVE